MPSTVSVMGASSTCEARVKAGPFSRGASAARKTKGLNAEPGCRRARAARLNWLVR